MSSDISLQEKLHILKDRTKNIQIDRHNLLEVLDVWQNIHQELREYESIASFSYASNTMQSHVLNDMSTISEIYAILSEVDLDIEAALKDLSEKQLHDLKSRLPHALFTHIQKKRHSKQDINKCKAALQLSPSGYHAWNAVYSLEIDSLRFTVDTTKYSLSEIDSIFTSKDSHLRQKAFNACLDTFSNKKDIFAHILNSIAGFDIEHSRLSNYKKPFERAFEKQRVDGETISAIWKAKDQMQECLSTLIDYKATLLHKKQIDWYDVEAPLPNNQIEYSIKDALDYIKKGYRQITQDITFIDQIAATDKEKWPNSNIKAHGAFCAARPLTKKSHIHINYSNSWYSFIILAHEFGHAWHEHILFDYSEIEQLYPLTFAENASFFSEFLVMHALEQENNSQKLFVTILYQQISRFLFALCNMHVRYIFEEKVYNKRTESSLTAQEFCSYMIQAQEEGYFGKLQEKNPYFWISKLHFFLTKYPHYHFPYVVGHLLACQLYISFRENPGVFADMYINYLRDTRYLSVEEIVKKYFQGNAHDPNFWANIIKTTYERLEVLWKQVHSL